MNLQQNFFKKSALVEEKRLFCIFEPPFGGLGAMHTVHLRLIGKHVIVITVLWLRHYKRKSIKNWRFRKGWVKFWWKYVQRNVSHQQFLHREMCQ